jgi:Uma2 family endonuclease
MRAAARPRYDRAAYLALERIWRGREARHELVGDEIVAMSGAKPRHHVVTANVSAALHQGLADRCTVCSADQRVTVVATGESFYPDVVVVCGEWALDEDRHGVTNPTLVVEVLSPTTEAYDRAEKVPAYKRIPEVGDIVLVDVRTRTVSHHRRVAASRWLVAEDLGEADVLDLGLGLQVAVRLLFVGLDGVPEVD